MRYLTFSSIAFVWAVTTESCGAWVNPLQNALNDWPAAASESVHEALVKAAIIPDGRCVHDNSIDVAFPLNSRSLHRLEEQIKPSFLTNRLRL